MKKASKLYKILSLSIFFLLAFSFSSLTFSYLFTNHAPVEDSSAKDVDVSLSVGEMISISVSDDLVELDITPIPQGTFSHAPVTVYVDTNDKTGYILTMSAETDETDLISGSNTIKTLESEAEIVDFPLEKWGYSLDSENYSSVPTVSSPDTIASSDAETSDSIDVDFGTKISTDTMPGEYKNTIVFTGTTNYVEPAREKIPLYHFGTDMDDAPNSFNLLDNDGNAVSYNLIFEKARELGLVKYYDIPWYNEARHLAFYPNYINCYDSSFPRAAYATCSIYGEYFSEPTLVTGGMICRNSFIQDSNDSAFLTTTGEFLGFCINSEINFIRSYYDAEADDYYNVYTGWLDSGKSTLTQDGGDFELLDRAYWITYDFIKDNLFLKGSGRFHMYPDKNIQDVLNTSVFFETLSYTNFVKTIEAMGYTKANFTNGPCADGNC